MKKRKETPQERTFRYLKRSTLHEVRETYFNTTWTTYSELKDFFKQSGWTRGELVKADRPSGRGEARWEKRVLYWYLAGKPDCYQQIPEEEIAEFEELICNNLPTIVRTWHGPYEYEILYNTTYKRLLRCVRESIYVNKDPDHCGVGRLPDVEIFNDGGVNKDIRYQVITFSLDS